MAAIATLAAGGVLLLFWLAWLCLPARDGDHAGPLGLLLWRHTTPRTAAAGLLLLAGLFLFTWQGQVEGLCFDLTGRRWLVYGYPLAVVCLVPVAIVFAEQVLADPRRLAALAALLPRLAWGAAAIKLALGTAVLAALARRGLQPPPRRRRLLAGWLLAAAALWTALTWVLPPGAAAPLDVALAVILFLPFSRLALAPLALSWDRHR
jgi:hypothetical protein